ncbi:DUF4232 domain-containing protein [Streptomyces phaeochromogenes]|uniref:DUF4232 domain-containing protein n=1 Tax=Streptomyces phaeochromogenes TaxID=1923 RepID=UPI002DDC46FB|nr:DUF4232 domain-containing protein [Streptomyces phaeochromogenes]WRZ31031.1 DUF4232 domain-containing protein [Streptomyces phaeochromogenes]WSJ06559.1 DUF4232 domain-containing protein [Streptomyces phaeochromogenes]
MRLKNARRTTLFATLGLAAALTLTACGGGDDDTSGDTPSGAPSSSASAGATETGASGSGSSGGSDAGATATGSATGTGAGAGSDGKTSICRTDELEVNAADNTTDKKEGVVTVQLKNAGGRDCSINGYAGVDLKAADGSTLSVERNGEPVYPAVLKNGDSAAFNITFPYNNSGGSGVRLTDILVTPPNETKYVRVAWPAGTLPVTDGSSSGKLQIGPATRVG